MATAIVGESCPVFRESMQVVIPATCWVFTNTPPSLQRTAANREAVYICDSCGEEIVVPVDISAGAHQDYVEGCVVRCHPMTLHVGIAPTSRPMSRASTSSRPCPYHPCGGRLWANFRPGCSGLIPWT